ncbi:hypothetical protein G3I74_13395 [Wenzhouxiangella sp. C33]|uniref:Uncharacterized protein n=1 Tax=Wenzhouxiangella limi TaxID=2707351 RepID=A0A845V9Y6_9GAMM|nr:hypothetical protein [Wenzhouxiangella limi]
MTMVLLLGLALIVGAVPARTLLPAVWPASVEELVLPDGRWILQPARWGLQPAGGDEVQARSRPLSVLEVHFEDGSRERGYVVDRTAGPDGVLILQTGPKRQRIVPESALAFAFYPNDMRLGQRLELALARLKRRAVSQTPSPR